MKVFNQILSFLWRCWFVFLAVIATIFIGLLFVYPFSFFPNKINTTYYFQRVWAKIIYFGSGNSIKKHDYKEITAEHPYVVISNHTSMMDIMLMFILNKKPMVFVAKKELLNLPVFGLIFKRVSILVDRKDPKSRMKVFRACSMALREGKSVCIFPEGGVPDESVVLKEFLDGPFAISIMNKVPLVTLTFCGMKQILPYAYFRGRPGKVHVFFNQALETNRLNKTHIQEVKGTCYDLIKGSLLRCK